MHIILRRTYRLSRLFCMTAPYETDGGSDTDTNVAPREETSTAGDETQTESETESLPDDHPVLTALNRLKAENAALKKTNAELAARSKTERTQAKADAEAAESLRGEVALYQIALKYRLSPEDAGLLPDDVEKAEALAQRLGTVGTPGDSELTYSMEAPELGRVVTVNPTAETIFTDFRAHRTA